MGKNPCILCATPDAKIEEGVLVCFGCGRTSLKSVVQYLRREKKDVAFDDATFTYERSPFATRISFGEWLVEFNLRLIARP